MRIRVLICVLAAGLAATVLAGCRTNVGAAANVSGHKISESDVSSYLTPNGPSSAAVANARANGQTVAPRSEALQYLIFEKVFEQTLRKNGGVPSGGTLASYHDRAASLLLQASTTGAAFDRQIDTGLTQAGIAKKLTPVFLRVQELEYTIIVRKQFTQLPELITLIKKAGVTVQVNPRYGKWSWSAQLFGLDGKAVTPNYLSVQPTPAAAG